MGRIWYRLSRSTHRVPTSFFGRPRRSARRFDVRFGRTRVAEGRFGRSSVTSVKKHVGFPTRDVGKVPTRGRDGR